MSTKTSFWGTGWPSNAQGNQLGMDTAPTFRLEYLRMRSCLLILPLAALLACGGSGTTGPGSDGNSGCSDPTCVAVSTTAVNMHNLDFFPEVISVASGATVTWTNNDAAAHNVTFDGGAVPASGTVDAGAKKSLTMPTAAGTYPYKCTIHSNMTGKVIVR
jgi:plastocyanin